VTLAGDGGDYVLKLGRLCLPAEVAGSETELAKAE
jgi:hypothetical protein